MLGDSVLVVGNPALEENMGTGVRQMDTGDVQISRSYAFGGIREFHIVVYKKICHEVLHDHGGIPSPRAGKSWVRFRETYLTTRRKHLPGMSP
jgi:hypothetical protein